MYFRPIALVSKPAVFGTFKVTAQKRRNDYEVVFENLVGRPKPHAQHGA